MIQLLLNKTKKRILNLPTILKRHKIKNLNKFPVFNIGHNASEYVYISLYLTVQTLKIM